MKVLMIDNYDSFTYNLVQLIRQIGVEQLDVIRNDKTTLAEIEHYDKYIISPGPGVPNEAPLLKQVIEHFGPTKSILGICLGHQAIGETFGSETFCWFSWQDLLGSYVFYLVEAYEILLVCAISERIFVWWGSDVK